MQILSISICIASLCLQREHCSEKSVLSLFTTLKEESINKRPSNNWEAKRQRRMTTTTATTTAAAASMKMQKNSAPHTQYIYNQYGRQNWQYFKVSTQSLWVRYCYVRVHVLCMRYFSLSTFIFSLFSHFYCAGGSGECVVLTLSDHTSLVVVIMIIVVVFSFALHKWMENLNIFPMRFFFSLLQSHFHSILHSIHVFIRSWVCP